MHEAKTGSVSRRNKIMMIEIFNTALLLTEGASKLKISEDI